MDRTRCIFLAHAGIAAIAQYTKHAAKEGDVANIAEQQ